MHMHVYASSSARQRFPFKAVLLSPRWSPHGCCTQAAGVPLHLDYIGCTARGAASRCVCVRVPLRPAGWAWCRGLVCSPGAVIQERCFVLAATPRVV